MVFISLTALQLALIVTFFIVAAELIAVSVAYTFLRVFETGVLQNGGSVSLPRHRRRSRYVALGLMLAFVGLETLFSLSSDTDFAILSRRQTCVSVLPYSENVAQQENIGIYDQEVDTILSKCRTLNGTTSHQAVGNFSLVSSNVSCSDASLYSFNVSERVVRSVSHDKKECAQKALVGFSEPGTVTDGLTDTPQKLSSFCVFYDYVDGILFLTTHLHPEEFDASLDQEQQFLPTRLNFNASASFIRKVARRALQLHLTEFATLGGLNVRRVSLTETVPQECSFEVDKMQGTNVPVYVIIIFATIGVALLFTFVWALWVSRERELVDLSNPHVWTENYEGRFQSKNVKVELSQEDGKLCASDIVTAHLTAHEKIADASEKHIGVLPL